MATLEGVKTGGIRYVYGNVREGKNYRNIVCIWQHWRGDWRKTVCVWQGCEGETLEEYGICMTILGDGKAGGIWYVHGNVLGGKTGGIRYVYATVGERKRWRNMACV